MGAEVGEYLVDGEMGESRTPNMDHSVADALRELSVCLARLADTLDQTEISNDRRR